MSKRSRRNKPATFFRKLKRFSFRLFFATILVVVIGGGAGYFVHQNQGPETQAKIEHHTLTVLDLVRENRRVPTEVRLVLDFIADRIPLHVGLTVDAGSYDGDRTHILGGLPKSARPVRILENAGFIVGYDEERGNPAWVAYRAFKPDSTDAPERPERFVPDTRTRARVHPDLYTNTGFDRGHMAPNYAIAVLHGKTAQAETFAMSNIVPQSPALNRQIWRDLEQRIIRRYPKRFTEVWTIVGPVYSKKKMDRLGGKVAVPTGCFMIIIDEHEKGLRALALLAPQEVTGTENPSVFLTSIREIEKLTDLDFLTVFDDSIQDVLELHTNLRVW